jgi:UDP-N-acetylmuramoylalanine--D-glutamate ligase
MKNIYKNKRVVVMGLGLNGGGAGVAKFFAKQGANVLVTDLKTKEQLQKSINELKEFNIDFVLGGHKEEDFASADLIIKNPAVPNTSPFLKVAKDHNVSIKTDIEIFFDSCKAKIVGVTGTKGKSTTATLIYLFLKEKYPKVFLAGNIGVTPLEIISEITEDSLVVLELSSFELEELRKSPHVAVITNLFPDHLNRYKYFKDYVEVKKNIFKYQNKENFLVLNSENVETKKLAGEAVSQVLFFNDSNVLAAMAVAEIFRINKKSVDNVLKEFKGIPNRQEFIGEKNGVKYFNDTTATNPGSCIYAIKKFKKEFPASSLVFIIGGVDKEMDYSELAGEIKKNINKLILLPGSGTEKLKKDLGQFAFKEFFSMAQAVKEASLLAKTGDIVVLSPASASFNLFDNEFDRGKQFVEHVRNLK